MFYIVLEYGHFWGLFINKEDAEKRAKEVGGDIWVYDMTEAIVMDEYGEVMGEQIEAITVLEPWVVSIDTTLEHR